ncbi:MAG TPA: YceI family protein [Chitinophagaceae bacterium]|nr:YceI family protein [Chitinophagaceae bacterium]
MRMQSALCKNNAPLAVAFLLFFTVISAVAVRAQDRFFTRNGSIYFNCSGKMEKIEAINKSTTCVLDTKTGALQMALLMRGFEFERALMQEHFNENYVESDRYPRAVFKGTITNLKDVNFSSPGEYKLVVQGNLTIHGVSKDIAAEGTAIVKQGSIALKSSFSLLLNDYNISIPSLVADKISNTVKMDINCLLQPLQN